MKRLKLPILVCFVLLAPATARADDGGFWDWLFRMDTTFTGFGTDFHLRCLDANKQRIPDCEHMFGQFYKVFTGDPIIGPEYSTIKHEINLRAAYYWSVGHSFPGAPADPQPNGDDKNNPRLMAVKVMPMYVYHFNEIVHASVGAGVLPIFTGSDLQLRGVITPLSITFGPRNSKFFIRGEGSILTGEFSAAEFGATGSPFKKGTEWNWSLAAGFDLRRIAHPAGTPRP